MNKLMLSELLKEAGLECLVPTALDKEVVGVVSDSRQVRANHVFAAIAGRKKDGHGFIDDAVKRGAIAIVSEKCNSHDDAFCAEVDDIRSVLGELATVFHGRPSDSLEMIGITGTNGKTSTAYIIRDILRADGRVPGLLSTVEYEIGARAIPAVRTTPEPPVLQSLLAQMVAVGCKSAVMEVSSHALVQKRIVGIDYDAAVFTNLTRDHLDYHETMEAYFDAKALLFESLGMRGKSARAIINIDDSWGRRLFAKGDFRAEVFTYGTASEAMIRAEGVELDASGSRFILRTPWGESETRTGLMGRFNVSNVLAAVAVCGSLGVEMDVMADVLSRTEPVRGRIEEVKVKGGYKVFVDYAHTDDALEHVLHTLREICDGRLILVFGCGGDRYRSKRSCMGVVAGHLADHSIITSDNPRSEDPSAIIAEIRAGFDDICDTGGCETIEDREEAIRRAMEIAARGDIVIIAGKGHEN
ncbi:MAG: UDP-N-acetylmuramoyl-L-alanyl-D-glutamate--2,6-diaminopimelate ligase, partial [Kiritimatiellae bacterium]|nr:UDP-N-acetylmuramoyl-L-alanyl-D-glutamate--2,6-diaminopimelate ligase [Kiritimatiellia bacterium]